MGEAQTWESIKKNLIHHQLSTTTKKNQWIVIQFKYVMQIWFL